MAGPDDSLGDLIEIGRVGKPHGVRGGFHLDGAIDAAALVPGFAVVIARRSFVVESRAGMDSRPLVVLAEVSDRDAIETLRGESVFADRSSLTPLAEGEWYAKDLVGLTVRTEQGAELGTVTRIVNAPSVDVLEVSVIDGDEVLLIPMVGDAMVEISPDGGEIVVNAHFLDLG